MTDQDKPSLKSFDAYADRNGQDNGEDDARDVGLPQRTQADMQSNPMGEAETARLASGRTSDDATDATAAETPAENLRRISDPRIGTKPDSTVAEAIDRATASLGKDE